MTENRCAILYAAWRRVGCNILSSGSKPAFFQAFQHKVCLSLARHRLWSDYFILFLGGVIGRPPNYPPESNDSLCAEHQALSNAPVSDHPHWLGSERFQQYAHLSPSHASWRLTLSHRSTKGLSQQHLQSATSGRIGIIQPNSGLCR